MPDMNENAETQQEYLGKSKIETDYKDLSMRLYKRIAELEAQIEKMKCCQNCSHLCGLCELGISGCYVCSKWKLRR